MEKFTTKIMFLFLHGIMETNSSLVPLIKSIFDLQHGDFSDKYLLDCFTIKIPGFDDTDASFKFKDIESRIKEFSLAQSEVQKKLAQELIFCKNQTAVSSLKEDKLNVIGNEIGAGMALEFSTKNPELISSITSINCGINFSGLRNYFRNRHIKVLSRKKIAELQSIILSDQKLEDRKLASIFLENPEQKGFGSYLKLMNDFDFDNQFHRLSINEQNEFTKVPILCIVSKKKAIVSKSQIISFGKLINPRINLKRKKYTFISFDEDDKSRFYYDVVDNKSQNLLEVHNLTLITNCIKKFLQN